MTSPDLIEEQNRFVADLIHRAGNAQARGLNEPLIAKLLLDQSFEAAMCGEVQELFDHILWVSAEAERMMGEFHRRLGPRLDPEALAQGIVLPKGSAA
ncbi:MAG: hypothetical protein AAF376_03835 [Pseudomonadota bacterium]